MTESTGATPPSNDTGATDANASQTPPSDTGAAVDQASEDKEWAEAEASLLDDSEARADDTEKKAELEDSKQTEKEEKSKNEQDDSEEQKKSEEDEDEQESEVDDEEAGEEDSEEPGGESSASSSREARVASRQAAAEAQAVKDDVRKEMFADTPTELTDADGNPIKTIEDVMELRDSRGELAFDSEEKAAMWLMQAQRDFNENLRGIEKQIDDIAETNLDLKDQIDSVMDNFGPLLEKMPELRDELWLEYEKTFVKDEKTDIITKAPVSLERFYTTALKPYADLAEHLSGNEEDENSADENANGNEGAENKTKAQKKDEENRDLSDRSDIYGGSSPTDSKQDAEDKEWAEAEKAVFG